MLSLGVEEALLSVYYAVGEANGTRRQPTGGSEAAKQKRLPPYAIEV